MEKYTGKSVLKGIAIGRIYWYRKQDYQVEKVETAQVAEYMLHTE